MKLLSVLSVATLAALAPIVATAQSTIIPGLYVTGVDASGNRLGAQAPDPHWQYVTSGGLVGSAKVVKNKAGTCRLDLTWLAPTGQACWIWQKSDGTPVTTLRFRTTFDLTGFDFTSASISGSWATDNTGINVYLNGIATGNTIPGVSTSNFGTTTPFSIASGFQAGVNTLDFEVENTGGPGGFLVQSIGGTANLSTVVPEPGTYALMGAGLLALGVVARRRRV